ncbi:MAG TPA: GNAT family N-acetyltransferase [Longimicrobiaceae bacterium]|nr:GNAT family N-acetyltransferase [Longimicrobiaceae bacterium]
MIPRTERLLLREFTLDDLPAVLAYHRDPRYLRYYPERRGTEPETRRLVQRFVDWQQEEPRARYQWAVLLPEDGRLIGNGGIRIQSFETMEADIGYELDPEHWGRGYASELAAALLRFGFTELGLHRITAHCVADNVGSARVLEKVGMRQEGRLRESEWMQGRWWDRLLFGILAHEWRAGS